MQDIKSILGIVLGLALLLLFWWQLRVARDKAALLPHQLFKTVKPLLQSAAIEPGLAIGSWKLSGIYKNELFQLLAITDTLALRKLPSLWLLITLPKPQAILGKLDLMMRPSGPTSFSNFDFLPHTLATPSGFPDHAVLRSDNLHEPFPLRLLKPQLELFQGRFGKELLASPQGLRLVVLVAEADRARYGVFREANFGDTVIDAETVVTCMESLLQLDAELKNYVHGKN